MRGDACDLVATGFREPDIPIKIGGDAGLALVGFFLAPTLGPVILSAAKNPRAARDSSLRSE